MDDSTIFDDTLFSILKECKTLPNFLDVIFGFLKRRTDFYCIAPEPKSPVGLPVGWSEYFVRQAYMKWKPPDNLSEDEEVPEAVTEVTVSSEESNIKEDFKEAKSVPLHSFSTSESYNGAEFGNYTWSQNITDVDIIVKVPENVTSKNLSVIIQTQKISIMLKDSNITLLEGDLCQKVKHHDALWSLDKRKLEIHLDKAAEIWWDCLVQNEPKLDVSKIDCSRPFEDLPAEAQSKIEELTWNQERKRLGLPTSEDLVMQEKLKKAWNAEGSPFKGPFDPDSVIIHS